MSTDFWLGTFFSSLVWAVAFILFTNWNYGMLRRVFDASMALKVSNDQALLCAVQQLENTEAVRDAWKIEAEKYKRRLLELGEPV